MVERGVKVFSETVMLKVQDKVHLITPAKAKTLTVADLLSEAVQIQISDKFRSITMCLLQPVMS